MAHKVKIMVKKKVARRRRGSGTESRGPGGGVEIFCLIIKQYVQMSTDSRCKYVLEIGCQREKFTI